MESIFSNDVDRSVSFLQRVLDVSSHKTTVLSKASVSYSVIKYADREIIVHSSAKLNSSNRLIVAIDNFSFFTDRIRSFEDKKVRIIPDKYSDGVILITGPGSIEVRNLLFIIYFSLNRL
jgi:hypothetical protein